VSGPVIGNENESPMAMARTPTFVL
jgi:hypothetical protein